MKKPKNTSAPKKVTITRRIPISLNYLPEEAELRKAAIDKLFLWRKYCQKGANLITTHRAIQQFSRELLYFTDEVKEKLMNLESTPFGSMINNPDDGETVLTDDQKKKAKKEKFVNDPRYGALFKVSGEENRLENNEKNPEGILTTSNQNSTYQVLSNYFYGKDFPSSIQTSLNQIVSKKFNDDVADIKKGDKSVSSYKQDMPIPFDPNASMLDIRKIDDKDYSFNLFKSEKYQIKFRTRFGADLSGNQEIFERALRNEYKFCGSSIQIETNISGVEYSKETESHKASHKDGNSKNKYNKVKFYILAVFQFDQEPFKADLSKEIDCKLSLEHPIIYKYKNKGKESEKTFSIGSKEEFLHRRLAIQGAIRRIQAASKFNKGGKGIQKKISSIERYKANEKNYIKNRMHNYSRELINICLKSKIGVINLIGVKHGEELAAKNEGIDKYNKDLRDKEADFVIRNWSYYGLADFIKYKAHRYGIEVIES